MRNRYLGLVGIAIALGLYTVVVGHQLESSFFITSYAWGWVAVSALRGRLDTAKAMAATMAALLLLSVAFVKLTPLGQGNLTALFSLAFFPSLVAWACVYVYADHAQRRERTPNVTFETMIENLNVLHSSAGPEDRMTEAALFTRSMITNADHGRQVIRKAS